MLSTISTTSNTSFVSNTPLIALATSVHTPSTYQFVFSPIILANGARLCLVGLLITASMEWCIQTRSCLPTTSSIDHVPIVLFVAPPARSSSRKSPSTTFWQMRLDWTTSPCLYYPFSDVNISFVPPLDLSSSIPLSSITHLSIVNFRISQSFLAAFPRVVQVTLAMVLEPEENA